ncbi:MAG: magnesium-translocating P-type ATPase [Chlamydiae bacterium]|nr:magnesium-translocating P-type ATPase [Chlamydiota bacterium]
MEKFPFWHQPIDQVYAHLQSQKEGLTGQEAQQRLKQYGPNSLKPPKRGKGILLFFAQFKSPIILLLIGAALLSALLGGHTDSAIILTIVLLSGLLGFFQERGALTTLEKLMQIVENKATVLRDNIEVQVPFDQIVPGDLIHLQAGDLIPADCLLLEAHHLFIDEASLTGESFPSEKMPGRLSLDTPKGQQTNLLFLGTMVASGFAKVLVIATGRNTEYSAILEHLRFRPPETAFETGVRKFGNFLLEVTLILVITIFAVNAYLHKPIIDSFLFSVALAVGLTPQLLPAIITVNLSHGARRMAKKKVIIKRLPSIENFGQMNILCVDKTGTITSGNLQFDKAVGIDGSLSDKTELYGFLNAHFQAGYANPMDTAILQEGSFDVTSWNKIDEIPYDFSRKRLSICCEREGKQIFITKGAAVQVLATCKRIELPDGSIKPYSQFQPQVEKYFEEQSKRGQRILALSYEEGNQEKDPIFLGFLHFNDPIKPHVGEVIKRLEKKGVHLKIITGDHQNNAAYIASVLDLPHTSLITGSELNQISDSALLHIVKVKNIFAEIQPNQKERIVLALRKGGNIVGFLGDGVNDVSALHSADVGIAVDTGADCVKAAADIVLLEKDLSVLEEGIVEGRSTFVNTLKYVYMATSSNFGNMFSMASISLFLSFLPLLPKQVLLSNFLSDLPEMALATDYVDPERVESPVKWDLQRIKRFMLVFGILNSLADFFTFFVLLVWLKADVSLFRSGWFIENVISAALVIFAIRTKRYMFRSKPGKLLTAMIGMVIIGTMLLPFTSFGTWFELETPPPIFYGALLGIVTVYIFSVEVAKRFFFHYQGTKHFFSKHTPLLIPTEKR